VHERASDIHIEPTRHGMTIRYRIDGVLQEIPSPPAKWVNAIISRLKVLSNMDLAEKRVPQDGRIRLTFSDKKLDLRVSNLPTIFGESIVMRILDQSQVMMGLEDVGFLPSSIKTFNELIRSPNGVILMTGPTGSGKTTTLYAALGTLNTPDHKLVTLEDPVEYQIPGINQIQINQDIGLDFALGLRSVLRQSPDIILVGEIRDTETAENAIRAALTGHLVFSTLHTNDAPSATVRLIDMGIKPYLVASSLQAVIAQRLVRRICPGCKESWRPTPEVIQESGFDPDEYANRDFFRGRGCERCNQHGYRGRTAIHEIMVLNSDLRRRVIRSEPASRLKKAAVKYGMHTLRMDGWEKCLLGSTTIDEVMSITASDTD
jgi:type II secretory ATPase GspE/PulE/Tfp pilus assembly ATPase PilB-like protein